MLRATSLLARTHSSRPRRVRPHASVGADWCLVAKSTQTAVTLGWTASTDESGIAEYGLYRDGTKVASSTTTSGEIGGLECGKTYTLGVDASDKAQNRSAVSPLSAATAPCSTTTPPPPTTSAPSAPPNLHATTVGQTSVGLAWDSSTATNGMAGYQIFRDGAKIGEGPGVHGGFTNEWNDSGRTCGTSYQYAVAGVDSKGNVGTKATMNVSTAACATTPPPTTPPPTTPPPPRAPAASHHAAPAASHHAAPAAAHEPVGADLSGQSPHDVRDADGRRARVGREHGAERDVRLPDLPRRHEDR